MHQIFETQNANIVAGQTPTFSFDLKKIQDGQTVSEIVVILSGLLTTAAITLQPEQISQIFQKINITYAGGSENINISGQDLEVYNRLECYNRNAGATQLAPGANQIFHCLRIPLLPSLAGVSLPDGRKIVERESRHPSALVKANPSCMIDLNTLPFGAAFVSFAGQIMLYADTEPQQGFDGAKPLLHKLSSTTDEQSGTQLSVPRCDLFILGTGAFGTFQVNGVFQPPLTPDQFTRLEESYYIQTYRYDEARTAVLAGPGLGQIATIAAGVPGTANFVKAFDRRNHKTYQAAGISITLDARSSTVPSITSFANV